MCDVEITVRRNGSGSEQGAEDLDFITSLTELQYTPQNLVLEQQKRGTGYALSCTRISIDEPAAFHSLTKNSAPTA